MKPSTITIDGPAASGKSTVGERVAEQLGYLYFDTGVMYRAVTWAALDRDVPVDDEAAVTALAEQIDIDVTPPTVDDGRQYTVTVDGTDVTWAIRQPEVDANVSLVSTYGGVRAEMVRQQRRAASVGQVVMVGRDIGSVVLPEADLKVYLDATVEERARRRWRELAERGGDPPDYAEVLAMMRERDRIDSSRAISPLSVPKGAVVVDSTGLTIDQTVERVVQLVVDAANAPGSAG